MTIQPSKASPKSARGAVRCAIVPLLALACGVLPALSHAQSPERQERDRERYGAPRIEGFNVDEVTRLAPGVELNFSLYGTPGGSAVILIDGASRNLTLNEVDAGVYEGVYTIGSRDKIAARSPVTANLRVGNQVSSGVLSESLLKGVGYHARPGAAPGLKIERFSVQPNDDLNPGSDLQFTVRGTPGAKVDMTINGTKGVFFLPEVQPGEYTGTYTIKRYDRVAPNSAVVANLRKGERVASMSLNQPLLAVSKPPPRVVRECASCATVEAVNVVQVNGDGSYLGTVGGGVVGALLGSQVGSGNGRTAAQIAGAVGGAYAGRNLERQARKTEHHEVVVRFANGGTQTVAYENDPGYRVGDKVRVNNGTLVRE